MCALLSTLPLRCRCIACQVSVSEANAVLGTPGMPFLDLLQSAFDAGGNDVRRHLRRSPAAQLLRHSRQAVRCQRPPACSILDHTRQSCVLLL